MKCPKCNSVRLEVVDSRQSPHNGVRRRRKCQICDYRFTTYEITEAEIARFEQTKRKATGMMKGIMDIIQQYG